MKMEMSIEEISKAISLKVIADSPDNCGPFVLEYDGIFNNSELKAIAEHWGKAFKLAGRVAPPLFVLCDGMKIKVMGSDD